MRSSLLCVAVGVLVLVVAGPTAAAPSAFSVTGSGTAVFPVGTPVAGDSEDISVKANTAADGSVTGHFSVIHHLASGGISGNVSGDVTCMAVTGNIAQVSGVITKGKLPGVPGVDPIGARVAITVVDNGPAGDGVGVDSSFAPFPHDVADCAFVPPFLTLSEGNFRVNGA